MVHALHSKTVTVNHLMAATVCSMESPECMLRLCSNCPDKGAVEEMVKACCEHLDANDTIVHQQWVSTDKPTLLTVQSEPEDFVEKLVDMAVALTSHHFTAKMQSQFLKSSKASLKPGEILVIMDFSENYSFIVQDAAQQQHWDNSQATVHPMVVYYKAEGGGDSISCISYCVISDGMKHSTEAVHVFMRKMLEDLQLSMKVSSVMYWSDGAGSQYKNL